MVAQEPEFPGGPVYRPAPGPRGHLTAGLHRDLQAARLAGAPARSDRRDRRPQHTDPRPIAAHSATRWPPARSSSSKQNCREFGIRLYGLDNPQRGIVHVIGPELGLTQPGMTIVCGDSHTATHGAFGALAFGIGTSEVEHVLATQCLLQRKPQTCEVRIEGAWRRA